MSKKQIKNEIEVVGNKITVVHIDQVDYISLTDLARYKDTQEPSAIISLWLRTYSTIAYLGLWESLHNHDFNTHIYEGFKIDAAQPQFWMSAQKWIKTTHAVGIVSKSGRYGGGTFAHPDIAFEFASWLSPEFKLYLVQEFERLKQDEAYRHQIVWSAHREIAKSNYLIHTQAIKEVIVPKLTAAQKRYVYASEADMLNVILFGQTAAQWRRSHPALSGNIRDYATDAQLKVLINLENTNAQLIKAGKSQVQRMTALHQLAVEQLTLFTHHQSSQLTTLKE